MSSDIQALCVALVYDRVNTPHGGAERVLLSLHTLFPQAPLYTSVYDPDSAKWASVFDVRTSFLQHIPFAKKRHREFLAMMPLAFSKMDLGEYDIVISVTSAEAKGITIGKDTLHICYLLTPPRYLWSHTHEYQTGKLKVLRAFLFSKLRRWDFNISQNIDAMIPISKLVKQRAEKYYRRDIEEVIYPPYTLETVKNSLSSFHNLENYFLIVGRLVPYKKVDLAIETCVALQKKLVIVGDGPDNKNISTKINELDPTKKLIHWFKKVSDSELISAYTHAKALLQLGEEDFGISILEAQACGIPVIANKRSGAAETIIPKKTGILLEHANKPSLEKAISELQLLKSHSDVIQSHVSQYNDEAFRTHFLASVSRLWRQHQTTHERIV